MTDLTTIFKSRVSLRAAFVQGLEDMLQHPELGVFILVLANASYDAEIFARLEDKLRTRFAQIEAEVRGDLLAGRPLSGAPDDVTVILKLMAVGLSRLSLSEFRRAGDFELQFNVLRAFRPPRMSDAVVKDIYSPFDAAKFNFNKPFLRKEIFWQGDLCGHHCRLLYNKFPFAELHGLLVIDPDDEKPQWLSEEDHQLIWQISETLGMDIPSVGFGYNSYGAYASVNHQHLQMFARSASVYPVEEKHWQHNGGDRAYPLACHTYTDSAMAWGHINRLHETNQAYNLLYRPGVLYVLPRAKQGSYEHAEWTGGFAWAELMGAVTTFNASDYSALSGQDVAAELAKLSL